MVTLPDSAAGIFSQRFLQRVLPTEAQLCSIIYKRRQRLKKETGVPIGPASLDRRLSACRKRKRRANQRRDKARIAVAETDGKDEGDDDEEEDEEDEEGFGEEEDGEEDGEEDDEESTAKKWKKEEKGEDEMDEQEDEVGEEVGHATQRYALKFWRCLNDSLNDNVCLDVSEDKFWMVFHVFRMVLCVFWMANDVFWLGFSILQCTICNLLPTHRSPVTSAASQRGCTGTYAAASGDVTGAGQPRRERAGTASSAAFGEPAATASSAVSDKRAAPASPAASRKRAATASSAVSDKRAATAPAASRKRVATASSAASGEPAATAASAASRKRATPASSAASGKRVRFAGPDPATTSSLSGAAAAATDGSRPSDTDPSNLEEGSAQWAVAGILEYNPASQQYLVVWEADPPSCSWVPCVDLEGCARMVASFHDDNWRLAPPPLQAAARRFITPMAGLVTIPEDEPTDPAWIATLERQAQLDDATSERKEVLARVLEVCTTFAEARDAAQLHLTFLEGLTEGAITHPDFFLALKELVDPQMALDSSVISDYFHRVLQPHANLEWYFADPCIFTALVDGVTPKYRRNKVPLAPPATLLLPCFLLGETTAAVGHWTLMIVVWTGPGDATVYVFDSIGNGPTDAHYAALHTFWVSALAAGSEFPVAATRNIRQLNTANLQGTGATDCAAWVMGYARSLLGGERNPLPAPRQLPFLRALFAAETLAGRRLYRTLQPVPEEPHFNFAGILGVPLVEPNEVRFCSLPFCSPPLCFLPLCCLSY